MATERTEAKRLAPPQIFDCESESIPPGTKSRARLPRGLEREPLPTRVWWLLGAAVVVALVVGVLIGRFLLA